MHATNMYACIYNVFLCVCVCVCTALFHQPETNLLQVTSLMSLVNFLSSDIPLENVVGDFSFQMDKSNDPDTRCFLPTHVKDHILETVLGERSFQYIGPVILNSLPFSVKHATSLSSFTSCVCVCGVLICFCKRPGLS